MPEVSQDRLGDQLDRLITIEARPPAGSVPAGLVAPLYQICRTAHGGPLSTGVARRLLQVAPGRSVLIATGAGVAPALPAGETDGPPGAVALARALQQGIDSRPILVTEEPHAGAVEGCVDLGSSLPVHLVPTTTARRTGLVLDALLDRYNPAAVVFVERDGANADGRYHGVRGNCRPDDTVARIDLLATAAERRGICTIGIGDGGNEVGFGGLREQVRNLFPTRAHCESGCPSGRITTVSTDIVMSAGVSNWGAYAVTAALAAAVGNIDLLPTPDHEYELVRACIQAGARDGATGQSAASVDGIPAEGHAALLTLMRTLVNIVGDDSGGWPILGSDALSRA